MTRNQAVQVECVADTSHRFSIDPESYWNPNLGAIYWTACSAANRPLAVGGRHGSRVRTVTSMTVDRQCALVEC